MHANPTTHPITVQCSCARATAQKIRRITFHPSQNLASTWPFSHSPTYQRHKFERLHVLRVYTMPHARRAWVYASSASGAVSMIFSVRPSFSALIEIYKTLHPRRGLCGSSAGTRPRNRHERRAGSAQRPVDLHDRSRCEAPRSNQKTIRSGQRP